MKVHYFGFGSLVNRDTRPDHGNYLKARLKGWRRGWEHRTESRPAWCVLSIAEEVNTEIDGVLVTIEQNQLAALDAREAGYDRLELPISAFDVFAESVDVTDAVYVYVSSAARRGTANSDYPLLQSYIDCVMAGYHREFGESGVRDFVATTRYWHTSVINDRTQPLYPRAVTIPERQLDFYDELIRLAQGLA